ncbi:MAG: phosphatidylinositol 4-kinase gamma 4 [Pedosphaera sp.]|nr:phosphatidylinositol 4-kinase gamma 4 [Pedosphaera sp.]
MPPYNLKLALGKVHDKPANFVLIVGKQKQVLLVTPKPPGKPLLDEAIATAVKGEREGKGICRKADNKYIFLTKTPPTGSLRTGIKLAMNNNNCKSIDWELEQLKPGETDEVVVEDTGVDTEVEPEVQTTTEIPVQTESKPPQRPSPPSPGTKPGQQPPPPSTSQTGQRPMPPLPSTPQTGQRPMPPLPSTPPSPTGIHSEKQEIKAAFAKRYKDIFPQYQKALSGPNGPEVRRLYTEAGAIASKNDFAKAGETLDTLEQLLKGGTTQTSGTTPQTGSSGGRMNRIMTSENKAFIERKLKTLKPRYDSALKVPGAPATQLKALYAKVEDLAKKNDVDGAESALFELDTEISKALLANQKKEDDLVLSNGLKGRFDVAKKNFAKGNADKIGKEKLLAGKEFKKFLESLKEVEQDGGKDAGKLDKLEAAANVYLAHFEKDLSTKQQNGKESQRKREICLETLKSVKLMRIVKDQETLGNPPWDEDKTAKAQELHAQVLMVDGTVKPPSKKGASDSFFLKSSDGKPAFLFKPLKGENIAEGFPPGGGVVREVIYSKLNDDMKQSIGLDFGICPTVLTTLESDSFSEGKNSKDKKQVGALVQAVANDGDLAGFVGTESVDGFDEQGNIVQGVSNSERKKRLDSIDEEDVQKIAVLDFLTLNLDRNEGNMLIKNEGGKTRLIPIDAGNSLPDKDCFLQRGGSMTSEMGASQGGTQLTSGNALMQLPQAHVPFTGEMLAKIRSIDPKKVRKNMEDSFNKIAANDRTMSDKMDTSSFELVERSAMFMKKVAEIPDITIYEISMAYGVGFQKVATAKPNELDAKMDEAIKDAFKEIEKLKAQHAETLKRKQDGYNGKLGRTMTEVDKAKNLPGFDLADVNQRLAKAKTMAEDKDFAGADEILDKVSYLSAQAIKKAGAQ